MKIEKLCNSELEDISVGSIKDICRRTRRVKAYISENDKTPSWDGELHVYEEGAFKVNFKKDKLVKKIPVQIKATQVETLSEEQCTFSMEVSDIRNYYQNEGALVFVVEIIDFDNYKIFYNDLLHAKLKEIIEEIDQETQRRRENNEYDGQEQKTKNLCFNALERNTEFFTKLLNYYIVNSNMQSKALVDLGYNEENVDDKFFMVLKPSIETNKFKNMHAYYYKEEEFASSGQKVTVPLSGEYVVFGKLRTFDGKVIVDDQLFYENYKILFSEDETILILNDYVFIHQETGKIEFSKPKGMIDDYLKSLNFQLAITNDSVIKFGDYFIKIGVENKTTVRQVLSEEIQRCNKLKQLLEILNLKQSDFLLQTIKEEDFPAIGYLIASLITKEAIPSEPLTDFRLMEVEIGTHNLLFEERYDGNNSYIVDILGNPNENKRHMYNTLCSPYLLLPIEYMGYFNYDLDKALVSITNNSILSDDYIAGVLNYSVNLIKYYDLTKNKEFLRVSLSLFEWLFDNNVEGHPLIIMKYTIIKRIRDFTTKELIEIDRLKDKEDVKWYHFIIYVLLDDLERQKELIRYFSYEDIFMLNHYNIDKLTNLRWRNIDMQDYVDSRRFGI